MIRGEKPTVSVIMSVYFEKLDWIRDSIHSILNQTYQDFEFIIVNDAPERKELQHILERFNEQDQRIVLLSNKKNRGLPVSLNKGINRARGKYIARMDADDISFPERLEKQFIFLENNEEIFLIGTKVISIDENGKEIIMRSSRTVEDPEKVEKTLLKKNCFYHPTIMAHNKNIIYRPKMMYVEDYDLYLRLLFEGKKLANLPDKLLYCRFRRNSICNLYPGKQALFVEKAKEFYFQRLDYGHDNYETFKPEKILSIDVKNTKNTIILKREIERSFILYDFVKTRYFCKRYFKNYGIFNFCLIYFILSYFPKILINYLLRILFTIKKVVKDLFFK